MKKFFPNPVLKLIIAIQIAFLIAVVWTTLS